MRNIELLNELQSAFDDFPDLKTLKLKSEETLTWAALCEVLLNRYEYGKGSFFKHALTQIGKPYATDDLHRKNMYSHLQVAIQDLKLDSKASSTFDGAYNSGEVYTFQQNLVSIFESATKSILLIDPFISDATITDFFACLANASISFNILYSKDKSGAGTATASRYIHQNPHAKLELRRSNEIHDRLVVIDNYKTWVIGASIDVAATAKPTYIIELSDDISQLKTQIYNEIWENAEKINLQHKSK